MTAKLSSPASAAWLFVFTSLALPLSGCATMFDWAAPGAEVDFTSNPQGALVKTEDGMACSTPCSLLAKPVREQEVKAELKGHEPRTARMYRRVAYPFWGNIFWGTAGIVGGLIDWLYGTMWVYEHETVHFEFTDDDTQKEEAGESEEKDEDEAGEEDTPSENERGEDSGVIQEPPPPPLPNTPEVRRLKEAYPDDYMDRQVRYYYGSVTGERLERIKTRLHRIMLEMEANGERADIDEAVRRDHFRPR